MKQLFYISILALLILSCTKKMDSDLEDFQLGKEEQFQLGEMNKSADNLLNFTITAINDSRCPSDVTCVWEGMVEVKIALESPLQDSIRLNSYTNQTDTAANHTFELINVTPYPVSTKTIELKDYDVTLKITALN